VPGVVWVNIHLMNVKFVTRPVRPVLSGGQHTHRREACGLLVLARMNAEHDGAAHRQEALDAALRKMLRALAVTLGVRRAAALVFAQSGVPRLAAHRGIRKLHARYLRSCLRVTAGAAYWYRLRDAGRALVLDPATTDIDLPPVWARRLRVGAHVAVPLLDDGVLLGAFVLELEGATSAQLRLGMAIGGVAAKEIANSQAARERAERAARHEVLLEIVRDLNGTLPLPELLDTICRRTIEAFGAERVTIYNYHTRSRGYVPLADCGTPAHVVGRFIHQPYTSNSTPHRDEIVAGRSVLISRAHELSPNDRALLDRADLFTLLLLPLRAGNETRGMLTVGTSREEEFTSEQIRGFEVIAHHAATAITQARSLRAAENAARFRAAVSSLAVELNAQTSRTQALATLCERARGIFRASACALLLPGGSHLMEAAGDSELGEAPQSLTVALASRDHPAIRAYSTGEVVRVGEVTPDAEPIGMSGVRSVLAIPLVATDDIAGVLMVGSARRRHFAPEIVDDARVLGALAATVLRNLDLMARLHDTNAELRRVSSLKDQFLANASHELRTPLNIIIGYAQLMQEGTFGRVPDSIGDVVQRMIGSARDQLALVEDLLDLSRIELNSLMLKLGAVPLAPLFAELEFALASMLRNRPVHGVVRSVPSTVAVRADGDRLRQILTNLLSNAAKFTDTGTIELEAAVTDDAVRIAVRDTGTGIAAEDCETIFEPFRQVDDTRAILGAGLGLAIAHRLSTLMDGTLTVDSALGAGSTFSLRLPVAPTIDGAGTPPSRSTPDVGDVTSGRSTRHDDIGSTSPPWVPSAETALAVAHITPSSKSRGVAPSPPFRVTPHSPAVAGDASAG
jgi:signal transduction histidine kinase